MSVETLSRENRYQNEKIKEIELKMNHLDMERGTEEQNKKFIQRNMIDVVKRLATSLGAEPIEYTSAETITHKASELIQVSKYRHIVIIDFELFVIDKYFRKIDYLIKCDTILY